MSGAIWSPAGIPALSVLDTVVQTALSAGWVVATATDGGGNVTAVGLATVNASLATALGASPTLQNGEAGKWAAPGAAMQGTNLRVPVGAIDDAFVQFGLAAGQLVANRVDGAGNPLAVTAAPTDGSFKAPITPATVGTSAAGTQ